AGLELTFNSKLRGRSRKIRLTRDGSGRTMPADPVSEEEEAPAELRLTLDRSAQYFAEAELREAVLRHKAKKGIVLVQEPRSGDLLAAAVYPPDPTRNAALQDVFEPGSTFKIVAAAAVLEKGIFAPTDTVDCEGGRWALTPSVLLKDHEPEGVITLAEIIERSSNIGTAKLALRLGPKDFHRHCRTFGFGYKTGLPLPGESAGLLPALSALNTVRLANAGFGQGVAVTAIQLISAFSALANGGSLMEPRLILAVAGEPAPGPVKLRRVASEKTVSQLGSILEGVVLRGTGQSARLAGYRAAGKTGTAQKIDPATGRYSASDYLSSFIGYAPLPDPRFTILVAIDSPRVGYYGSEVAAPVFAKLARSLLALGAVPPDQPLALRVASGPNASRLVGAPASGPAPLGPSPSRKP
ncbi:MAG: penicillin-binding protein 2, partial [Elusimicrobiota bacterium]